LVSAFVMQAGSIVPGSLPNAFARHPSFAAVLAATAFFLATEHLFVTGVG
jgi:hypothetical protein